MAILLPYLEFEINPVEAVSLPRLPGWTLTAVNSRIWLTEESGGRDVWLQPGDRYLVKGRGRVVVEPWLAPDAERLNSARVRLAPPRGSCVRRWGMRWPRFAVASV